MRSNDQRIAIAECLGWRNVQIWPGSGTLLGIHKVYDGPYIPDFLNDANTRPQMLEKMTQIEKEDLLKILVGDPNDFHWQKFYLSLLELSQPYFCELFLKAKGLWREKE